MPYVEKKIVSGEMLEIERYFSTKGNNKKRKAKQTASSAKQIAANSIHTELELWRVICANFSGKRGDQFNTFTFAEDVDEEKARREWKNFARRMRRYLKKRGLPDLRYIYKVEKQGRWHIHAIMDGIPIEDLTRLWGRGRVTSSILDDTNHYRDLAAYLSKQMKAAKGDPDKEPEARRKYARNWSGSLNLKRPVVTVKEIKRESILKKAPAAPKGYCLLPDWEIGCNSYGNLYQYFKCRKIVSPPKEGKKQKGEKNNDVSGMPVLREQP